METVKDVAQIIYYLTLSVAGPLALIEYFKVKKRDRLANEYKIYDELNNRLMTAIQLDGRVYCSNAVLDGRFCLRSCIVNYRTEADDMDALLDVASELGAKLDAELRPEALR